MNKSNGRIGKTLVPVLLLAAGSLAGCEKPISEAKASNLSAGLASFEQRQFGAALAAADRQLAEGTFGITAARAYYLRGRVLEDKPAASDAEAAANLAAAATAYRLALAAGPDAELEPLIRASYGDVAYWQADYATALAQWGRCYRQISDASLQAAVLLRIGQCQQRLGQFEDADNTFAVLARAHPGTPAATQATAAIGKREFLVQVGVFSQAPSAGRLASDLKSQGMPATTRPDAKGRHVVAVGPLDSYASAEAVKQRIAAQFPDAMIKP
ncbi:MAG: SPOR domain-containing protein [Phycisphaerae bacterium]